MATSSLPHQTAFGCSHVQSLLSNARDKATEGYTRLVQSLRKDGGIGDRLCKSGDKIQTTVRTTYLCLQCPTVSLSRERHRKEHSFSVESRNGFIFCHECRDFVYDPTFEEIRLRNGKKRKASELYGDADERIVAANSLATPCAASGLRGLYNMGQTCFMSVVLQSLIHNPLIRTFYLNEGHRSIDCEREACTSCALDDVFTDFFGYEKREGYGAVNLLQSSWKGGGGLAGYSQQDAHEYLGFILNSLHTAIVDDDDDAGGRDGASKDCDCVIHQTFGGLLRSTVTCMTCKSVSVTQDPFLDLSLQVHSSAVSTKKKLALINGTTTVKEMRPLDLTECLDRFTSPETLSSESYTCRKCASAQEATKKMVLSRLPPVIPIHLKRFSHSKSLASSTKVDTRVHFPFRLDLSPYCAARTKGDSRPGHKNGEAASQGDGGDADLPPPRLDPIYELSTVIVHKGKIDNGHYICYSRVGGQWFRFDDSMVVLADEAEVMRAEAYILCYIVREFI